MAVPERGKRWERVAGRQNGVFLLPLFCLPQDSQLIASAQVQVLEVRACVAVESVTSARGRGQVG